MRRRTALFLFSLSPVAALATPLDDEARIRAIERELAAASLAGDAKVWDAHIAPNLIFTNPGGHVNDAKQSTEGLRAGTLKFTSLEQGEMRVQLHGDTAIVSFDEKQAARTADHDYSGHYQWTDTFIKRKGRWVLIARHGSVRH
jgi:ketosteroid isomerase-like protein